MPEILPQRNEAPGATGTILPTEKPAAIAVQIAIRRCLAIQARNVAVIHAIDCFTLHLVRSQNGLEGIDHDQENAVRFAKSFLQCR